MLYRRQSGFLRQNTIRCERTTDWIPHLKNVYYKYANQGVQDSLYSVVFLKMNKLNDKNKQYIIAI